jgi:hypothetical protein
MELSQLLCTMLPLIKVISTHSSWCSRCQTTKAGVSLSCERCCESNEEEIAALAQRGKIQVEEITECQEIPARTGSTTLLHSHFQALERFLGRERVKKNINPVSTGIPDRVVKT